jgi:hypothetical protein
MTEDDTFNRLRRPLYDEMRGIWVASNLYKQCVNSTVVSGISDRDIDAFFRSYGWDVNDYSTYHKVK